MVQVARFRDDPRVGSRSPCWGVGTDFSPALHNAPGHAARARGSVLLSARTTAQV